MVTTPEPTSITDSYSLLKSLNRHPRFSREMTQIKVLANRVENPQDGRSLYQKLNAVVSRYLKLPLGYLGSIPQDPHLSNAVMQQQPVSLQNENAKSSRAFEEITRILMYGEDAVQIKKRGMAAFFSHIVVNKKKMENENYKI